MLQLRHSSADAQSEESLREALGADQWVSLRRAADLRLGICRRYDPDRPDTIELLEATVRQRWAAVTVHRPSAARWAESAGLSSDHGPLAPIAGGQHAIVIVEVRASSVRYLDPYYPGDEQPLEVPLEQFLPNWLGDVFFLEGGP